MLVRVCVLSCVAIAYPHRRSICFLARVPSAPKPHCTRAVLVQDKQGGRVYTVADNRSKIAASRMAGGNKEGMEALSNLLGGGKK